jgi:hypothetical protein
MRKSVRASFVLLLIAFGAALTGQEREICRFAAGRGDGPFHRWLQATDVSCSAPNEPVPPGRWNVFARTRDQLSAPIVVENDIASASPEALDLLPAATLRLQLPEGTTAIAYATRHAVAFPVAGRALVPAGEPLLLLLLDESEVRGVIHVAPIEASAERTVDARDGGERGVLVRLDVTEADRAALNDANGVSPPRLEIVREGGTHPLAPLPPPELLHDAIVFAQDVPDGEAAIELSGRGWLPARQRIVAGPSRVTLVGTPIPARVSATLAVEWSTVGDLPRIDAGIGSCDAQHPAFILDVARCAEADDPESCRTIHQEPLPLEATVGTSTIGEVPPGIYRAELRFGKLPPASAVARLAPLHHHPLSFQAVYLRAWGSLTRGGAPFAEAAQIRFPTGVGFAPDGAGEYDAALTDEFGTDARIDIETCEGEKMFVLADRPFHAMRRFDLDVPENLLRIVVVDTFTRETLPSARLRYEIMSLRAPRRPVVKGEISVDDYATFEMRGLPERELRLTVSHRGYRKQAVPPFSITKSETKEIDVELVPLTGSQGKIDSLHRFGDATIHWLTAEGRSIESADVEADGSFFYDKPHDRSETLIVVSSTHPLWVTCSPATGKSPLQLRYPDNAPTAAIDVPPGMGRRLPILRVGGLSVPGGILQRHLELRSVEFPPASIPSIASTGPIDLVAREP